MKMTEKQDQIVQRIKELALFLGSEAEIVTCSDHSGAFWKKIVIEYNKGEKDEKNN